MDYKSDVLFDSRPGGYYVCIITCIGVAVRHLPDGPPALARAPLRAWAPRKVLRLQHRYIDRDNGSKLFPRASAFAPWPKKQTRSFGSDPGCSAVGHSETFFNPGQDRRMSSPQVGEVQRSLREAAALLDERPQGFNSGPSRALA